MKEIVEEKFQIFDRYTHTHTHTKRGISQTTTIVGCSKHTGLECEHLVTLYVQKYVQILGKGRD